VSEFETYPGDRQVSAPAKAEETEQDQRDAVLEAVLAVVGEHPEGCTSQDVEHAVPGKLLREGRPAVTMSRDRVKALLRELAGQDKIHSRRGQATVLYFCGKAEAGHAE
jgi:hypothetical protein